jgi:hypothetical protein
MKKRLEGISKERIITCELDEFINLQNGDSTEHSSIEEEPIDAESDSDIISVVL